MANTVWSKGVDQALSTPGNQVALPGAYFVSQRYGSNITGNGSMDNPWASVIYALDNTPTGSVSGTGKNRVWSGTLIIVDDGYYLEPKANIDSNEKRIFANVDGNVIIQGSDIGPRGKGTLYSDFDSSFQSATNLYWKGIKFINTQLEDNTRFFGKIQNCVLQSCFARFNGVVGGFMIIDNCFCQNSTIGGFSESNQANLYIDDSTILNSTIALGEGGARSSDLLIVNSDIADSTTIRITNEWKVSANFIQVDDSNFRPTQAINFDNRQNEDLDTLNFTKNNSIDVDPLYVGNQTNLELLIAENSPLIGAGTNNGIIGALSIGEIVDLSSPSESNDITVGPPIVITDPATVGNIKPQFTVFDQIRVSPPVGIVNGLPDNTNNVPDNESTTRIPNRRTLNVAWKETLGGAIFTGEFIYGQRMFKDNNGNYNGSDDFDISDISSTGDLNNPDVATGTNIIRVAEIQENFVLNDQ